MTTPADPNDPFAPPSGSAPPPSQPPAWGTPPPGYGPPPSAPPPGYGPPPGFPPPGYGQGQGVPTTNTLAIVAFVTTFLCTPAGLVCGILALGQIKKSGEQGRGLALAAVILSSLVIVGSILAIAAVFALGTALESDFTSTCVTSDGLPC